MAIDTPAFTRKLAKRRRADRRFKWYGRIALGLACAFLVLFFADMIARGSSALWQTYVLAEVRYDEASAKSYRKAVDRELLSVVSRGELRVIPRMIELDPSLLGTVETKWLLTDTDVDQYVKGKATKLADREREVVDRLVDEGKLELGFNWPFFTNGDSRLPEMAGIWSAAVGSILVLLVTLLCAVPLGVMTSIYLEEFAPDNRLTRIIEVNINNLAAVPSILFGLLGLAIIINFFGAPRSSPLAGGITLGLMMLPVVIIATRAALRAVPDSIREGAFGIGASRWQVVQHHVVPLALPGILTGSIISLAQAMGETAPLLIVGMMAYVPETPTGLMSGATVLPAQIYLWASDSQRALAEERTAAAILVLLVVLLSLNGFAIWLRRKTERRW